jgi:hypothetical protein
MKKHDGASSGKMPKRASKVNKGGMTKAKSGNNKAASARKMW